MVSRRTVLNGTAIGSALAALTSEPALEAGGGEAAQSASDRVVIDVSSIATSINALRTEVRRQETFWEIEPVRESIKAFIRTAAKLPDAVDVGIDIWYQVYDWHVKYQQPLNLSRNAEGRYTILLASTMVVMRQELAANYVGVAYDNR
jgi:hypothetical protein